MEEWLGYCFPDKSSRELFLRAQYIPVISSFDFASLPKLWKGREELLLKALKERLVAEDTVMSHATDGGTPLPRANEA